MTQNSNSLNEIHTKELSIQLGLNGLSFCILNTDTNTIIHLKHFSASKKQTPDELLETLKTQFETEDALKDSFYKITIIHENDWSTLVPKALFNEDALVDYLKLNIKILKTDYITFDTVAINDSVNVYLPYVNINNYIYDKFGSFTFKHYSTVLVEAILNAEANANDSKLYIHVSKTHFQLVAVTKGDLVLYNTFEYTTPEDFIYYVLFTTEQLQLNPETIKTILLGAIIENDDLYTIAYKYIRYITFGKRLDTYHYSETPVNSYSDFTLIKSLQCE
ncbi:DUF3822 family protein [Bizionia gelidisalsuginis]|uniref:DUF3822 family protein n=1 Tax=Bizionia gelidisalsuginis TaxID=291188 RepID=A0ABY3M8A4_9FLAO|nr:DUF3822 family protein [Bizionia gelidisalsuginis]TYC10136.1 DUF3822 family protein [Bizionia gelidisalsuginis]